MNHLSRRVAFVLLAVLLVAGGAGPLVAAPPDPQKLLLEAADTGDAVWRSIRGPRVRDGQSSRSLFVYALLLCETHRHPERLARLFDTAAQMQDRDPQSRTFGNFRWSWRSERVEDLNAVEFAMQAGALVWMRHAAELEPAARQTLYEILDRAVVGCEHHRPPVNYTNIALMNAANLLLLGEALQKPDAAALGLERLQAVYDLTLQNGTAEFDSPTYYGPDLCVLDTLTRFVKNPHARQLGTVLRTLLWTDVAANFFPADHRLAGAQSRTYDNLHGRGELDIQLWHAGWIDTPSVMIESIYPLLGNYTPPDALHELTTRFPRLVQQCWGPAPTQFRTHQIHADVTLSTSAWNYNATDMPLTVDLAGQSVRGYFIPDARNDPYGSHRFPVGAGHAKAEHLRPFWTAAQSGDDALGLVIYREHDTDKQPATALLSHFVLPAAHECWIDRQHLPLTSPADLPVQLGQSVFFRYGSAAVAVRVVWSRTRTGSAAPISLVIDRDQPDALRLTVDHLANLTGTAQPGAAFWVRIASGLTSDKQFDDFRHHFATTPANVQINDRSLSLKVPATNGQPLAITIPLPADHDPKGVTLTPAPTRCVLSIDGKDVGRDILQNQ